MKRIVLVALAILPSSLCYAQSSGFSTGFYGGASVGYQKSESTWTAQSLVSGGASKSLDASATRTFSSDSTVGAGILGFNYVNDNYLVGLETQAKFGGSTANMRGIPGCAINCQGTPGPANTSSSLSLGSNISILARLGWLPSPDLLVYFLGGVTRQNVSSSVTCQFASADPVCLVGAGNPYKTVSSSTHVYGPTIGIGAEKKFDKLSFRAELKYTNLDGFNTVARFNDGLNGVYSYRNKIDFYTLSLGALYHF